MMRIKALIILLSAILFYGLTSFAQDVNQIEWLSELDGKSAATYGDAVKIFALQSSGRSSSFRADSAMLEKRGVALDGYTEGEELSKGMLAKMTARYLDLGGSIMYLIFGTERYAYRACVAYGIMRENGSENDLISGPELVEVIGKISDMKGGK